MNTLVLFFSAVFVPENQGENEKKKRDSKEKNNTGNKYIIKLGIIHIFEIAVLRKLRKDCQFGL